MIRAVGRRVLGSWAAGKPTRLLDRALSVEDLRLLAARRLPRVMFDFIDGGAGDEITLRDNEAAFQDWRLCCKVGGWLRKRRGQAQIKPRSQTGPRRRGAEPAYHPRQCSEPAPF